MNSSTIRQSIKYEIITKLCIYIYNYVYDKTYSLVFFLFSSTCPLRPYEHLTWMILTFLTLSLKTATKATAPTTSADDHGRSKQLRAPNGPRREGPMGLELAGALDVGPTPPRQRTPLRPTRLLLRHSRHHHHQPRRRRRRRRSQRVGKDRRDGHLRFQQLQFGPSGPEPMLHSAAADWKPKQRAQLHGSDPVRQGQDPDATQSPQATAKPIYAPMEPVDPERRFGDCVGF